MENRAAWLPLLLLLACCSGNRARLAPAGSLDWPGAPPGRTPLPFAPGLVSRPDSVEFCLTVTPEGGEVFFTRRTAPRRWTIMRMTRHGGSWCAPAPASFSGTYSDSEPAAAPDGRRIYFSSNRPLSPGEPERGDYDVWYVERERDGWGEPRHAGAEVNGLPGDQWRPVAGQDNGLLFSCQGLWLCPAQGTGFGPPRRFPGPQAGGPVIGGHGFLSPDGAILLTAWPEGPGAQGGWDIYVSGRLPNGAWSPSRNPGPPLNTPATEDFPALSPDGKHLFFFRHEKTSDGSERGDIYWAESILLRAPETAR